MATHRNFKPPDRGLGGKYTKLRFYLVAHPRREWRTTFSNIESILGFELPASARASSGWWTNKNSNRRYSQVVAWSAVGWETAEVDMVAETLLFRPRHRSNADRNVDLDELLPPRSLGPWPHGLRLRREDIYEDRI
jgi:hypothetical protein